MPFIFFNPFSEFVIYGTFGILVGIITGWVFLWLLRQKSGPVQIAA